MHADLEEAAKFAGAIITAVVGSYAALFRQLKSRASTEDDLRRQMEAQKAELKDDVQRQLDDLKEELHRSTDELKDAVKRLAERSARLVDAEEFAAYTHHTSDAISKLSEKVGRATGALEAWYSRENRNR
jgi:methyl-accepting chemotaxis protein